MNKSKCRGCGREIIWGTTPDGKRVPLDAKAPTFVVLDPTHDEGGYPIARTTNTFVSHFATCPKAADFSGRNRAGAGAKPSGAAPAPTPNPTAGREARVEPPNAWPTPRSDLFPDRE